MDSYLALVTYFATIYAVIRSHFVFHILSKGTNNDTFCVLIHG
jgi:hypothetical protein